MQFQDRSEAGKFLAQKMQQYSHQDGTLVLALPRGGVPVALEIAKALDVPLDLFLVRKLGVPGHEELAFGAVASGGIRVLNPDIMRAFSINQEKLDAVTEAELKELERRQRAYRQGRAFPKIQDKTILLIDDGLATGATMRAAVLAIRQQQPQKLVVGVPVAAPETCDEFRDHVDEIICAISPENFRAVGFWYEDFSQLSDEEVRGMLMELEASENSLL